MSSDNTNRAISLDGLRSETIDWLKTPEAVPVVSLATQLIEQYHWSLLQESVTLRFRCLLVGTFERGAILLAKPLPNPEEIEQDRQHALEALPARWKSAELVYFCREQPSSEQLQAFQKTTQKTLSGRTVTTSAVSFESKSYWGPTGSEVESALKNSSVGGLLTMLNLLLHQQTELSNFWERVRETRPWASYTLMAICTLTFGWAEIVGSTTDNWTLLRFGANYAPLTLESGQWWRLIGSAFLHIGWLHGLVNMYSLQAVGPTLERLLGSFRFLGIYTLSALTGSFASAYLSDSAISAGASGAIFGLFGSAVALGLRHQSAIPNPVRQALVKGMLPAIGVNLVIGFSVAGIDNAAHLGGLVAGALAAAIIPPKVARPQLPLVPRAGFALIAVFLLGTQLFVLSQAKRGFKLEDVAHHQVEVGHWTVSVPVIFNKSPKGNFYEGPGINLVFTDRPYPVERKKPVPIQLAKWLGEDYGNPVKYDKSITLNGRDWLFFRSSDGISALFAVTQEDGLELRIGSFYPANSPDSGTAVVDFMVASVKP